jgi:hypothetical protein
MLYPCDSTFFDMLARFINSERVDPLDVDWPGMLAALGIVKGQPFNPDARSRSILGAAAKTGAAPGVFSLSGEEEWPANHPRRTSRRICLSRLNSARRTTKRISQTN